MKKTLFFVISLVMCFAMCKKDETCPTGFEGDNCNSEIRVKFYGTYAGTLTGGGQSEASQSTLTEFAGDVEKITWDQDAYLKISGSTTFDIPNQQVQASGNTITLEGNGSLDGNKITMDFKASMSGVTVDFNFVGTKQKAGLVSGSSLILDDVVEIISE